MEHGCTWPTLGGRKEVNGAEGPEGGSVLRLELVEGAIQKNEKVREQFAGEFAG